VVGSEWAGRSNERQLRFGKFKALFSDGCRLKWERHVRVFTCRRLSIIVGLFGRPVVGAVVDGMDAFAVYDAAGAAIGRARAGLGPTLLECKTYRYYGHAAFDNPKSYRTTEEENEWKARDAITKFRERVLEEGTLQLAELDETEAKITEMMDDAVRFSDESSGPELSELLTDVYVDPPKGSLGRSSHLFT